MCSNSDKLRCSSREDDINGECARGVSGPSEEEAVARDAVEDVRLRTVRVDVEDVLGIGSGDEI